MLFGCSDTVYDQQGFLFCCFFPLSFIFLFPTTLDPVLTASNHFVGSGCTPFLPGQHRQWGSGKRAQCSCHKGSKRENGRAVLTWPRFHVSPQGMVTRKNVRHQMLGDYSTGLTRAERVSLSPAVPDFGSVLSCIGHTLRNSNSEMWDENQPFVYFFLKLPVNFWGEARIERTKFIKTSYDFEQWMFPYSHIEEFCMTIKKMR